MITLSQSLKQRIEGMVARWAGSEAQLVFYSDEMPADCDDSATGEKVKSQPASENDIRAIYAGHEPDLPKATEDKPAAGYWRLLDNGGLVVMQGDGIAAPGKPG